MRLSRVRLTIIARSHFYRRNVPRLKVLRSHGVHPTELSRIRQLQFHYRTRREISHLVGDFLSSATSARDISTMLSKFWLVPHPTKSMLIALRVSRRDVRVIFACLRHRNLYSPERYRSHGTVQRSAKRHWSRWSAMTDTLRRSPVAVTGTPDENWRSLRAING